METECTAGQLEFHGLGRRVVVGEFDGGKISSDSGGLLLREVEQRTHILKRLASCFIDHRGPMQIEHSVESLIKQRVMGLALGYEDLNDHDVLRQDPLLALLSDVAYPTGQGRRRDQDKGCARAGKSTLNRLELTPLDATAASRYKKIVAHPDAMDELLVDLFLEAYETAPGEIILDVDATDDPLHGHQEGRFFHGYYRHYCYLPLYIFCGEQLLCARLRPADQDGAGHSHNRNGAVRHNVPLVQGCLHRRLYLAPGKPAIGTAEHVAAEPENQQIIIRQRQGAKVRSRVV